MATFLTLLFTPAMLAARVWVAVYARGLGRLLGRMGFGRGHRAAEDWALRREARRVRAPTLLWADAEGDGALVPAQEAPRPVVLPEDADTPDRDRPQPPLRAAE